MFNPFESSGSSGGGTNGKDGRGIVSIVFKSSTEGSTPGIAGALDTYEIKYTDNTSSFFQVKNGEDGNVGFSGDFSDLINIPNTIAGYGIQDANIVDNTITLGANSVDVLTQDDVSSTYSSLSASPVNGIAINGALQTLDASEIGGVNKIIQSVSETNGIISATAVDIASTYSATGTAPVNGAAINAALNTLDAPYIGGTGNVITSIREKNGIITATSVPIDDEPTESSDNPVSSGSMWTVVTQIDASKADVSSTLGGYGITDANITDGVIRLGANTITPLTSGDVDSTYSSTGTSPVNGAAINDALGTLDVSSVGGSGSYIESISETNGKISAMVQTMDTSPTSNSEHAITSDAVYTALADKVTILDVYGLSTTIESGSDLNNLTSVGVYNCLTNQIATTLSNCPTANGFRLEVTATISNNSFQLQLLYPNNSNGEFFMRRRLSSGWSSWTRFAADTSVYQIGTSLVSGDDLDNYTTVGRYYAGTSISGSILNKPVASTYGFELTVENNTTSTRVIQTITYNTSNELHVGKIYKRWYTTEDWSAWYVYEGAVVS